MRKKFNITGTCIPERHFIVDISGKITKIMDLIESGEYFTINRPRQYGKTTILSHLEKSLNKNPDYLVSSISFEGIGDVIFKDEITFAPFVLQFISEGLLNNSDLQNYLSEASKKVTNLKTLSMEITSFIRKFDKKVVLMIDEVDKSTNNQLFLSFLGMLRNKYLLRNDGKDSSFQSVILAGVHDVKTLKLKLRPSYALTDIGGATAGYADAEQKYNSPWNIAADFKVDMSFSPDEIATMLTDYVNEKKIKMNIPSIAERIYYYSSGYPFLVSILCKIIDEEILPEKKKLIWTNQDIESAVDSLLKSSNTNFDTLIKNLENYPNLNNIVFQMLIEGVHFTFNSDNPDINLGITHGIFPKQNGSLKIHNRIYEQRIYNYLSSKMETSIAIDTGNFRDSFISNKQLNFNKILLKFQAFMQEQYSKRDAQFLERNGRLIFLAYLRPIINGIGFDFKEVQISEERRLDIVVTFSNKKYVVELKIWRGESSHRNGLKQLASYLERQNTNNGYLVIFNLGSAETKKWKRDRKKVDGKEIFMVWV